MKKQHRGKPNNIWEKGRLLTIEQTKCKKLSKDHLKRHYGKWSKKQPIPTLGHVGKVTERKQCIRLRQPNEEIKKLVWNKKCLNGTQNMDTSILARNDSWKRMKTKIT